LFPRSDGYNTHVTPERPAPSSPVPQALKVPFWRDLGLWVALALLLLGLWRFHGWAGSDFWDRVPGDRVDGRFVTFCLEHEYRSMRGQGDIASPPIFYPTRGALGFSDALIGYLPFYSVFRSLGLNPFSAMHLVLWVAEVLAFLVTFGFLRSGLRLGSLPSAIGAFFYVFNIVRLQSNGQYQTQVAFILPLAAWCVASWFHERGGLGQGIDLRPAFAALWIDLQLMTGYYLGWFALFWGCVWMAFVAMDPVTRLAAWEAARSRAKDLWVALAAFAIGLIPFFLLYLPAMKGQPPRKYDDYWTLVPTWNDWLKVESDHPLACLFTSLGADVCANEGLVLRIHWGPVLTYLLILAGLAFLFARARATKGREGEIPFLASLVAATFVMALLVSRWETFSPWRWVFENVPGAGSVRAVNRVTLFLSLPVAITLAWVCGWVGRWLVRSGWQTRLGAGMALMLLVGLLVVENAHPKIGEGYSASKEWAYLERLASGVPRGCEAFYLSLPPGTPGPSSEWSMDAAWAALLSGVPTLHGYSGIEPPGWDIRGLKRPEYQATVQDWVQRHHLRGPICEYQLFFRR